MKVPFSDYFDMDSLLEKIDTCHNNPEKSSTTKKISIKPLIILVYPLLIWYNKNQTWLL